MIAVVYSGSRFANWKIADKGKEVLDVRTVGINPFFNDEKYIFQLLNKNIKLIHNAEKIKKIYFFGAGASSKERNEVISNAFSKFFRYSKIYVDHDLQAAAKASCNDKAGIVCILGSGSNAAFFDGKKIINNNYGLGYAIGDEGSANWLGKMLIKNYLTNNLPADIHQIFKKKYDLDKKQILDKIYKQAQPNVFLTSFVDLLNDNREHPFVKDFIKSSFSLFIETYLLPLIEKYGKKQPVYFVGTVAANFQDYLREVAQDKHIKITTIVKEPIYNLLNYYANKN
jgi:N-acetylglucosamine kinase-like BadF-type ATPase